MFENRSNTAWVSSNFSWYTIIFEITMDLFCLCFLASEGGIGVLQPQGQLGGVGFKIFDDSEKSTSSVPAATGEWQKAPLSNKITKENTQKATQWTRCKVTVKEMLTIFNPADMSNLPIQLH